VHAAINQEVDQPLQRLDVKPPIGVHQRDDGRDHTMQLSRLKYWPS